MPVCFIHLLLEELIAGVFELVLLNQKPAQMFKSTSKLSALQMRTNLRLVCKHWNLVSLHTSSLWTLIDTRWLRQLDSYGRDSDTAVQVVHTRLKRLDIELERAGARSKTWELSFTFKNSKHMPSVIPLMRHLVAQCDAIDYVIETGPVPGYNHADSNDHYDAEDIYFSGCNPFKVFSPPSEIARLKNLRVAYTDNHFLRGGHMFEYHSLDLGSADNLLDLTLDFTRVKQNIFVDVKLPSHQFSALRRLIIADAACIGVISGIDFLAECSRLEFLYWHNPTLGEEYYQIAPKLRGRNLLPYLKTIILGGLLNVHRLWLLIGFSPKVEVVQTDFEGSDGYFAEEMVLNDGGRYLKSVPIPIAPKLRRMTLSLRCLPNSSSWPNLHIFLSSHPSLEEIEIRSLEERKATHRMLLSSFDSSSTGWPRLTRYAVPFRVLSQRGGSLLDTNFKVQDSGKSLSFNIEIEFHEVDDAVNGIDDYVRYISEEAPRIIGYEGLGPVFTLEKVEPKDE